MWSLRDLLGKRTEGIAIESPTNEAYEQLWEEGKPEIDKIVQMYVESLKEAGNRYVTC